MEPPQLSRPPKKKTQNGPPRVDDEWLLQYTICNSIWGGMAAPTPRWSTLQHSAQPKNGEVDSSTSPLHTTQQGMEHAAPTAVNAASKKKTHSHPYNRPTVPLVDSPTQQLLNPRPVEEKHAPHQRYTLPQGKNAPSHNDNLPSSEGARPTRTTRPTAIKFASNSPYAEEP